MSVARARVVVGREGRTADGLGGRPPGPTSGARTWVGSTWTGVHGKFANPSLRAWPAPRRRSAKEPR